MILKNFRESNTITVKLQNNNNIALIFYATHFVIRITFYARLIHMYINNLARHFYSISRIQVRHKIQ